MYKIINGWTKDRMINKVIKEFRGKSLDESRTSCLYRGPKGKKCAAGIFIPNKFITKDVNSKIISSLVSLKPKVHNHIPLDVDALSRFQMVHDFGSSHFVSQDDRTDDEVLMDMLSFIYAEVEDV